MTALATSKQRWMTSMPVRGVVDMSVKSAVKVWQGALLTLTSGGYIRPLTPADTAANYVGIALMDADIGTADGDTWARVARVAEEMVLLANVASATGLANVAARSAVYSPDDSGAYTTVSDPGNNIKVAEVIGYDPATTYLTLRHITGFTVI